MTLYDVTMGSDNTDFYYDDVVESLDYCNIEEDIAYWDNYWLWHNFYNGSELK